MRFKGFIGPAYTLRSVNIEAQRCVNLYPEIDEAGTGKEGEVTALVGTPALTTLLSLGNGPIRLIHVDPLGTRLVVSGSTLYKVTFSGNTWGSTSLGTLSTSTGVVIARSNLASNGTDTVTVLTDGTTNYAYKNVASVESFGTFAALGYSGVPTATHVCLIDGFFVFNKPGTSLFYTSDWNTLTVNPLSFASAEGSPDNIVAILENYRELWLFGETSIEVFVNVGNPDFPFERVQSGYIEKGCMAPYSVAKVEGAVFWLGRDASGQGIVYAAQGLTPQRISTHAIENAIQGYSIDSITAASAYTYSSGGHSFYVLNFPGATWVYDLTTKLWHERAYNNVGTLERHRGAFHAFDTTLGLHLVGDYQNNKIYKFNESAYQDDTTPIIRLRSTPHVYAAANRIFHKSLQLDMEVGVGLDAGVQGSDPQAILDWSNDGGHTWSNEHWVSLGKIGEYKKRAKWNRLGLARDRIYRVRVSDPVKINFVGAEIDVEQGAS